MSFRTAFYKMVPSWLRQGEGELVLWSMNRLIDAYQTRLREGLTARFPSYAGDSALRLIGLDRGIIRGRSEPRSHYVARLKRWRWPRGHRTRGSAFALLEQIGEYWGVETATFDVNRNLHARTADGVESHAYGVTWDWDGSTTRRYRFWVYLSPVPGMTSWGTWADFATEPGSWSVPTATWGQRLATADDAAAMRRLMQTPPVWKPGGTSIDYMVVALSTTVLLPAGGWGTYRGRAAAPDTLRFWRIGPRNVIT